MSAGAREGDPGDDRARPCWRSASAPVAATTRLGRPSDVRIPAAKGQADLAAIKSFLLEHTEQLSGEVAELREGAERYYALAKARSVRLRPAADGAPR